MTGVQAQLRKDLRLNIAYEKQYRKEAPLGKIGNLTMTNVGSPKARMPGVFERFVIFWKAVYRAKKENSLPAYSQGQRSKADIHRVQKYTGELFGKLQMKFVESNDDEMFSSIKKTARKLYMLINYDSKIEDRESIKQEFRNAVMTVKHRKGDASTVRAGLEYLLLERKSSMLNLPKDARKILHEMGLAIGVRDSDMYGVLYFRKNEKGDYNYYQTGDDFEEMHPTIKSISSIDC